ncbi:carboxylating nicotinate-nucleotide diphosphorylase [Gemmatimonas aurantiaca]|nr:carboxylating nicotinate-nucleotide diphosphorylase [Gemmatimonas aurantiaca]
MPKLTDYITTDLQIELIRAALKEDIRDGDITTIGCLGNETKESSAKLIAKSNGVLAGIDLFALVFAEFSSGNSECERELADGDSFSAGQMVATVRADASVLLTAERVALNFLGRLSGIASLTALYVAKVKHTKCVILDTRKTTPLWRALEKYAVVCGGAQNHRSGLYDMALIKENHIAACGSIREAVTRTLEYLQRQNRKVVVEVEVRSEDELREALDCGVERILLDNQTPKQIAPMVTLAKRHSSSVLCEASGNVTLDTVTEYAEAGVDYISIGALTHSAPNADFSLLIS